MHLRDHPGAPEVVSLAVAGSEGGLSGHLAQPAHLGPRHLEVLTRETTRHGASWTWLPAPGPSLFGISWPHCCVPGDRGTACLLALRNDSSLRSGPVLGLSPVHLKSRTVQREPRSWPFHCDKCGEDNTSLQGWMLVRVGNSEEARGPSTSWLCSSAAQCHLVYQEGCDPHLSSLRGCGEQHEKS